MHLDIQDNETEFRFALDNGAYSHWTANPVDLEWGILQHGPHRFKIEAKQPSKLFLNDSSMVSETIEFRIRYNIMTSPQLKWLLLTSFSLLSLFATFFYREYRNRIKRMKEQESELQSQRKKQQEEQKQANEKAEKRELYQKLQVQQAIDVTNFLDTHDMVNVITGMKGLNYDKTRAEYREEVDKQMANLAEYFTMILNKGRRGNKLMGFLKDELKLITLFIEIQNTRFAPDIINYECFCPTALENEIVVSSVLFNYVNNAVKHGIRKKEVPTGLITVQISKEKDILTICVEDDGLGISVIQKIASNATNEQWGFGLKGLDDLFSIINTIAGDSTVIQQKCYDRLNDNKQIVGTKMQCEINTAKLKAIQDKF